MATTGNFLSPTITRLELVGNSNPLGVATGFFLKYCNEWYLISNWHVFSGRNPTTGQPLDSGFGVPDCLRYTIYGFINETQLKAESIHVELGCADSGTALWYQHPTMGQDIDIGCLPLNDAPIGFAKNLLDPTGHDPDMCIDLGHDLFLPGFPLGFSSYGMMPLWKRASLASSLEFGPGIDTYFYVDTATRSGMSGAPCLAISNWKHYRMDRSTGKVTVVRQPLSHRLLGVYSGRRNASDGFEAQIGVVWRENRIFEILDAKSPASIKLRAS